MQVVPLVPSYTIHRNLLKHTHILIHTCWRSILYTYTLIQLSSLSSLSHSLTKSKVFVLFFSVALEVHEGKTSMTVSHTQSPTHRWLVKDHFKNFTNKTLLSLSCYQTVLLYFVSQSLSDSPSFLPIFNRSLYSTVYFHHLLSFSFPSHTEKNRAESSLNKGRKEKRGCRFSFCRI